MMQEPRIGDIAAEWKPIRWWLVIEEVASYPYQAEACLPPIRRQPFERGAEIIICYRGATARESLWPCGPPVAMKMAQTTPDCFRAAPARKRY